MKNEHLDKQIDFKQELKNIKQEYDELGGWKSFKNGEWVLPLVQRSFQNYYNNSNMEYYSNKYNTKNKEFIEKKLISIASKNAMLLGGITGAVVSADEITTVVTGGEGIVGLPTNIAVAMASIAGEAILLMRMQLQLIANLAKLYNVTFDSNDPEDILIILALALGVSATDVVGKFGVKIGGNVTQHLIRTYVRKDLLKALKKIGKVIGLKILQKTIVKYTVPIVSIGIGGGWNYITTRAVGKITIKCLKSRLEEVAVTIENS